MKTKLSCASIALIVIAVVIVAILVTALVGYVTTRNGIIKRENALSAQYQSNQNDLSKMINQFYEEVGLTQVGGEQVRQILSDAIQGRYGDEGFNTDGALFVALSEAYPDLSFLLDNWGRIQDHLVANRQTFADKQDKLLDMIRVYKDYKDTGWLRPLFASLIGAPTDHLKAKVGNVRVEYGQAALDQMETIVISDEAGDAFDTGSQGPMTVPGSQPSAPTPAPKPASNPIGIFGG